MKKIWRCCKCKTECEELWEFGPLEIFRKYWGKEYCEECFNKLFEKIYISE